MADRDDYGFTALLRRLLAVPAPSGREEQLAAAVREIIDDLGYEIETDACGNLLVRLPGRKPDAGAMMLAAHLDEIGLVVTGVDAGGVLRVDRSGMLLPHKLGECPVQILGDAGQLRGIVSMGAAHGAAGGPVTWSDVRVITGATAAQLAAAGIRVGSTMVPLTDGRGPHLLGAEDDPLIAAWTLDDRAGVVTLLRLLAALHDRGAQPHRPLLIAFTTHEENGAHGAKFLAHRERPELFIAIDGCPMQPGSGLTLDHPVVWSKDSKAHYDQQLIRALCACADAVAVPLQVAVLSGAFSDASQVRDVGAVPRVGIIGHARENSHGYEVARLSVFDRLLRVLVALVQQD